MSEQVEIFGVAFFFFRRVVGYGGDTEENRRSLRACGHVIFIVQDQNSAGISD